MPFTTRNNHHLGQPQGFSLGPTTGFLDNVDAAFRRQREVESAYGLEIDLRNRWYENLKQAEIDLERPFGLPLSDVTPMLRRSLGEDPYSNTWASRTQVQQALENQDRIDQAIEERRKADPEGTKGLRTFKEIVEEEKRKRAETIAETNLTGARSGFFGTIGGFIGGMAGSFDPARDPLLFSSLGIPVGAGGHIARRMLLEGFIGGGVETLQQTAFVQPTHKLLGEEEGNILEAVLFATVGSAAFRGAIEGAGPAARAVEARVSPQRAGARIIAEQFEAATGRPLDFSRVQQRQPLSPDELLAAVKKLPESPQRFAMEGLLTNEVLTREASPNNVDVRFGRIATEEAVDAARREFEGAPETVTPGTRMLQESQEVTVDDALDANFTREKFAELDQAIKDEIAQGFAWFGATWRKITEGDIKDRSEKARLRDEQIATDRLAIERMFEKSDTAPVSKVLGPMWKRPHTAEGKAVTGRPLKEAALAELDRRQATGAAEDARLQRVFQKAQRAKGSSVEQAIGEGTPLKQSALDELRLAESFVPEEKVDEIFGNIREAQAAVEAGNDPNVAYGYRNVTHNGVPKVAGPDLAAAKAKIEELKETSPDTEFELVVFDKEKSVRAEWTTGQGRAGNDFLAKQAHENWVPRKDKKGNLVKVDEGKPKIRYGITLTNERLGTWRVTVNGKVLGDSRGFSRAGAIEDAKSRVAGDEDFRELDPELVPARETDDLADIDIGLLKPVRADLQVETENGTFTVREILDDITDDDAMLVATRECGI